MFVFSRICFLNLDPERRGEIPIATRLPHRNETVVELSSAQHPLNERIYILVSHLNRNLVAILRINNCPRVSAMSVDDLSHAPRLIGISPVVLGAVQNQRFRFY